MVVLNVRHGVVHQTDCSSLLPSTYTNDYERNFLWLQRSCQVRAGKQKGSSAWTHLCEFALAATQSSEDIRKWQFTQRKELEGHPWVYILTDGTYLNEIVTMCVYIYIYVLYVYLTKKEMQNEWQSWHVCTAKHWSTVEDRKWERMNMKAAKT